jgi:hypothetical protein
MRKLGQDAVSLDAVLAETARDGATRLKPFGKTLTDAINFYLNHLNNLQHSISAEDLETLIIAEFDRRLRGREISERHHGSMRETRDRDWLPFFAISAFTGLRSAEVERLRNNDFSGPLEKLSFENKPDQGCCHYGRLNLVYHRDPDVRAGQVFSVVVGFSILMSRS